MLPDDWIEHRRADGEIVGWIVMIGDGFVAMDALGRQVTPEPVDWLDAETLLEERGLGFLAEPHELEFDDGSVRPVRISEASAAGVVVLADEFGKASAVGAAHERFHLPFPAPERLRRRHNFRA